MGYGPPPIPNIYWWHVKAIVFMPKQFVWCRWRHRSDLCFPEVWGRGLDGPWHCSRCTPCTRDLKRALFWFKIRKKLGLVRKTREETVVREEHREV